MTGWRSKPVIMDTIIQKLVMSVAAVGLLISSLLIDNPKVINPLPEIRSEPQIIQQDNWQEKGVYKYTPTLKQKVWIYSLFWCESRGNYLAINPKDLDNTPSYGIGQFKPETLKYYASRYGLLSDNLEIVDYTNWTFDPDLVYEIVSRMVGERNNIKWSGEFPSCVRNLGLPPRAI